MGEIGKITEYVSNSETSFDDAIKKAVFELVKTNKGVRGVDVIKMTARAKGDQIIEYRVNLKVSSEL